MKPLCIYHNDCADGFAAAWAVREALGPENVEFHAGVYQDGPPSVVDRDVILVDFSYKRPVIEAMATEARSILILDHHKSAIEDLAPIVHPVFGVGYNPASLRSNSVDGVARVHAVFDLERSGASIAWDYFHPGKPRPQLIDHIEDADLHILELPGTKEIMACLFSYPWDFEAWDKLMRTPVDQLREEGAPIHRAHLRNVERLIGICKREMVIRGFRVPVVNAPRSMGHDAAVAMMAGHPFAAAYYDGPDGRTFSLRSSTGTGEDVSAIARTFGGGGHKHAAGFRVSLGWEGDQF